MLSTIIATLDDALGLIQRRDNAFESFSEEQCMSGDESHLKWMLFYQAL